jgi:DNA-binding PadR family transcriptional regulator
MLKYVLLGFLNYHPLTGYNLMQIMSDSTSNFWHADLSQIYKTLKTLEEAGLIASTIEPQQDRPDRRIYTVLEPGRRAFQEWLTQPLMDMSSLKESLVLKVFFAGQGDVSIMLAQLQVHRELHRQNLTRYTEQTPLDIEKNIAQVNGSALDAVCWDATRRAGIFYEEMYLRWLDETISRLEALATKGDS